MVPLPSSPVVMVPVVGVPVCGSFPTVPLKPESSEESDLLLQPRVRPSPSKMSGVLRKWTGDMRFSAPGMEAMP